MEEKVLQNKKNGMIVLVVTSLLYLAAVAGCIFGGMMVSDGYSPALLVVSIIWLCIGWIPYCGLRILKPQEALVMTLFGNYTGTLKNEGFYFVNPFSSSVNPAASTHLHQSGDVDNGSGTKSALALAFGGSKTELDLSGKKISLKIMTLNNNRQKINDCLGNPVEIGIAVMWRVVDTAKAVFNVDNYKDSVIRRSATSSAFILTMWRRTWIRPATALPMREAFAVPVKSWRRASGTRSRNGWKKRDWK